MTHLWRYVGVLLGVSPDLLPVTAAEGRMLVRLIGANQEGPDDDGRALAEALLAVPGRRHGDWLPGWLQHIDTAFRAGFARLALGTAAADAMGLPHRGWKYVPLAIAPLVYSLELARCIIPGATAWNERLGERIRRARVARWLHGEPPTYIPHDVT